MNHRNDRSFDPLAFLVAVAATGAVAVAAAWWYGITWRTITSASFGLFSYAFMFAGFVGMPVYFIVLIWKMRRRTVARSHPAGSP